MTLHSTFALPARASARVLVGLSSMALATTQAYAQEQQGEDAPADSAIVVTGQTFQLTEIGGTQTTLRETPQSITVFQREQLDAQNMRSLDDVMIKTTGVTVLRDTSDEYYYYIRGQEVNSFQWDGQTLESFPYINNSPNMAMFEEVQILRGANGVLNAAKSFGAVNLIRKRPSDAFKAQATLSYGSWDNLYGDLDVGGPLEGSDTVRGRAVVSYQDRDAFYDYGGRTDLLLYGLLEFDLSPDTTLTVSAAHQHLNSTPYAYGMPTDTDGNQLGLSRDTFLGAAWNRLTIDTDNYYVALEHDFGSDWSVKLSGTILNANSASKMAYNWGAYDPESGDGAYLYSFQQGYKLNQSSVDLLVQGKLALFGRKHDIAFGGSWYRNDYNDRYSDLDTWLQIDPYAFDGATVGEPEFTGWQYTTPLWKDDWKSVFGTGRFYLLEDLTLTAGARATWYHHRFDAAWEGEVYSSEETRENGVVTPYLGLTWDLTSALSLYVSYADIFTPQTSRSFEGNVLEPIVGANYEGGIKAELFDRRLNVSVAYYQVEKSNEAIQDLRYDPVDYGGQYYYIANGKTRTNGVEVEILGNPLPGLSINAGYTLMNSKVIEANEDVGRPWASWVPKHMLRVWTDYRLPFAKRKFSLGAAVTAQSKVSRPTGVDDISLSQSAYALLDLRLAYRFTPGTSLAVNVNNVFDKTYIASVSETMDCCSVYGEPRSVIATLKTGF